MNIRFIHKLIVGFALSGILVLAIYVGAVRTVEEAGGVVDRMVNVQVHKLASINSILAQASRIRTLEVEIPYLADVFAASGAAGELWMDMDGFDLALRTLTEEHFGRQDLGGSDLIRDWDLYRQNLQKTLALVQESRFDEASRQSNYESRPRYYVFFLNLQGLSVRVQAEAEEERQRAEAQYRSSLDAFRILSLLWLGIGLVGAALFARSLSGRVVELRRGAGRLAAGDMEYLMPVRGRDELAELARSFNQMSRQIRSRQEALRQSELRFRALVETSSDWIWEVDASAVYTYASPKVKDLLGYDPSEVVGKTPFDLMPVEEARRIRQEFGAIANAKAAFSGLINLNLTRDGREVVIETNGVPIFDAQGEFLGYRGVDRDITERKMAEEALRRAHDQLELRVEERTVELTQANAKLTQEIMVRRAAEENLRNLNKELDAFIYTLSHDLRNPLGAIIGTVDYLCEEYRDRLDQEGREFLVGIAGEGRRMMDLMEDLLSLARVGRVRLPEEPVDPRPLARQVVATLDDRVSQLGAVIRIGEMPLVRVPSSLLLQLFDNLIGNALRYGCPRQGVIEVGGSSEADRVRYFVRDHGPGIAPEDRERVFEVFYRGATGAALKGTGVGLATVQKIAKVFGGRAWVEQTPGGGSTFWVEMLKEPPGQ